MNCQLAATFFQFFLLSKAAMWPFTLFLPVAYARSTWQAKKKLANKIKIVGRQLKTWLLPKMESYDLLDLYQYVLPVYCSCSQVIHLYLNYYKLDM